MGEVLLAPAPVGHGRAHRRVVLRHGGPDALLLLLLLRGRDPSRVHLKIKIGDNILLTCLRVANDVGMPVSEFEHTQ